MDSSEPRLRRAILDAAWSVSAFGLRDEMIRILKNWTDYGLTDVGRRWIYSCWREPLPNRTRWEEAQ